LDESRTHAIKVSILDETTEESEVSVEDRKTSMLNVIKFKRGRKMNENKNTPIENVRTVPMFDKSKRQQGFGTPKPQRTNLRPLGKNGDSQESLELPRGIGKMTPSISNSNVSHLQFNLRNQNLSNMMKAAIDRSSTIEH